MTSKERARDIIKNDPFFKSLIEEGRIQAAKFKHSWCQYRFMHALPGPRGQIGALWFIDEQICPRVPGEKRYDVEVRMWLRYALEEMLPDCKHTAREGLECMCPSEYPVDWADSGTKRKNVEREHVTRQRETGFVSLIEALRNAGNKED